MIDVPVTGYFVECPHCRKELRINSRYLNQRVACKFCAGEFDFRLNPPRVRRIAFYSHCPHCANELRAAEKYIGQKVACKHCNGGLRCV